MQVGAVVDPPVSSGVGIVALTSAHRAECLRALERQCLADLQRAGNEMTAVTSKLNAKFQATLKAIDNEMTAATSQLNADLYNLNAV